MEILPIILYILGIIALIFLIILSIKCINFINHANVIIEDIEKQINSCNYIFDGIEKVSLFILNIPNTINNLTNKLVGNVFKRKDWYYGKIKSLLY